MTRFALSATIVALMSTAAVAEDVAPSDVAYDDYGAIAQSLTGVAGDPAEGLRVMETRSAGNCVACHQVSVSTAAFQGNVGPSLDGVADRWDVDQLRGLVANAKMVFPDTVMPSFYRVSGYIRPGDAFTGKAAGELSPLLTAQQIEDVVAYLQTLSE